MQWKCLSQNKKLGMNEEKSFTSCNYCRCGTNEAVQKDNEYCNYYCWPSIFASKTPDLAPNAEHSSIWYTEW